MGKRKYNHEVGNIYLLLDDVSYRQKRYVVRLVVQKKMEKRWTRTGLGRHEKVPQERYGMFSISVSQNGKFHINTSWIGRQALNGFARHCVIREEFEAEGHRLGFLVITGTTIEGLIEKAVKRYQKNVKYRYSVKWDPDEIKGLLKYVEPEGDINGNTRA
jgi:hypothetical protein